MDLQASPSLWGAEVDAGLAKVSVSGVRLARLRWAVERRPVAEIAAELGVDVREVKRILHGGRLAGGVYASIPWPDEALAALHSLRRIGAEVDLVRGAQVHQAKLRPEDVLSIREQYRIHGRSANSLAAEYGLHHETVRDIVRGASWRHVTGGEDVSAVAGHLPPEPEAPPLPQAITGRLEWLDEVGAVQAVFATVRDAERASGEDRLAIAAAANSGKGRWRYELQAVVADRFDPTADDDDENDDDWYEIPEVPAKPTRSRRY